MCCGRAAARVPPPGRNSGPTNLSPLPHALQVDDLLRQTEAGGRSRRERAIADSMAKAIAAADADGSGTLSVQVRGGVMHAPPAPVAIVPSALLLLLLLPYTLWR